MAPASTFLLALAARGTVVLAIANVLVRLLGRRRMAGCHRLLTATALALLLLPVLPGLLPRWELRLPGLPTPPSEPGSGGRHDAGGAYGLATAGSDRATPAPAARASAGSRRLSAASTAPWDRKAWAAVASILWFSGLAVSLLGLLVALRRERRLVSSARPLEGAWGETLREAQRALGVGRPVRLLASDVIDTPATSGWGRPVVLLPAAAASWCAQRRRVVLEHELVHVQRRDGARRLLWRLVVALYWWNPLARLAAREAAVIGEHACDQTVLDLGTPASVYARHLMEIAVTLGRTPRLAPALPMVERSQLQRRLQMILETTQRTGSGRASALLALALLLGAVGGVAAALPRSGATTGARPTMAAPAQPAASATSTPGACLEGTRGSFDGFLSEGRDADGRGGGFTLQQLLGQGQRLCARVQGDARFGEQDGAIQSLPVGSTVLIETRGGRGSQLMRVTGAEGGPRYEWWRNGTVRPVDDEAKAWLADALAVMAGYRAIGSLQGKVGGLQGEIGGIQGEIGGLQGKVGGIEGERGGLEGEIGGHQGAIGGLEGRRWQASPAEQARIDEEIQAHRAAIAKLEKDMEARRFDGRIADAEAELKAAEEKGQPEIAALERRIADLHAEDRIAEIERRMKPVRERLEATVQRLGS